METQIRRRRWIIWIGLVFTIVALSLYMPQIINVYMGVPRVQAPQDEEIRVPKTTQNIPDTKKNLNSRDLSPSPTWTILAVFYPDDSCTSDMEYWLNHPDQWHVEGIIFGDVSVTKAEALVYLAADTTDLRISLLQQFIVYRLNTFRGVDPSIILPTEKIARDWLRRNINSNGLSPDQIEIGKQLIDRLTDFNQGRFGPRLCPEVTDTPTPVSTTTLTPTLTESPSSTPTSTATIAPFIPRPTETNRPRPRRTPVPPPPTSPPPTPIPTNTEPPPPPTQPPPTQPPPTSVPTAPPTPTSPPG